jgi:IS1 family transposase
LDADSKLIISWLVGDRSAPTAEIFMRDVAKRLANRVQLTTDGHNAYLSAVHNVFDDFHVDFAQLVKLYGETPGGVSSGRYSPAECIGTKKTRILGNPDKKHISTSFVERQNLTMRMHMRRFTRLTNAFSKKIENHCHAIALHFIYYNFVKTKSLRVTPAMEAGIAKRPMTIEDIVNLTSMGMPIK